MVNTTSLYRRSAVWLFILICNSCLQKQDALIISANNSEPFVQVRCILVPGFPAQIHSKKVQLNPDIEWQGVIQYTIRGSNGTLDSILVSANDFNEYFTFKNITVTEGVTYSLVCRGNEGEIRQQTYTPKKLENLSFSQRSYVIGKPAAVSHATGGNLNNQETFVVNPMSSQILLANPSSSIGIYGDTSKQRTGSGIGFNSNNGVFSTQIVKLSAMESYSDYIVFNQTVFARYDRYFEESTKMQFKTPFHLNTERRYALLYQEKDSNRSFQNAALLCDARTMDLLKNIPETFNEETVPAFSNIPAYPLNINSNGFKGYLISYTLNKPPVVRVTDVSNIVSKVELVNNDGSKFISNKITQLPIRLGVNYKSYERLQGTSFALFDYGITQLHIDIINEQYKNDNSVSSFEIKEVLSYNLVTDKVTRYEGNFGVFQSAEELVSFLGENNTLTFYEK
jgi:hypothetical protein